MSNLELLWSRPPNHWRLNVGDVHIWASCLNRPVEQISSFKKTLSPDESARAERFHFDRDRSRFIAGRGILREILSSYLEMSPSQLRFVYSLRGKPGLANCPAFPELYFNVTHSNDLILIGVTQACTMGLDVEERRSLNDADDIAAHFFSAREAAAFKALPKEGRELAFFKLWTRKEACLKAAGLGLQEVMDGFEVSFLEGEPAKVLAASDNLPKAASWTLEELYPAQGFVAAVAMPTKGLFFHCWQWPL